MDRDRVLQTKKHGFGHGGIDTDTKTHVQSLFSHITTQPEGNVSHEVIRGQQIYSLRISNIVRNRWHASRSVRSPAIEEAKVTSAQHAGIQVCVQHPAYVTVIL